jgi:hypothetical protein
MATVRCPMHDTVVETETDHRKPGARTLDSEGKPTGPFEHPMFEPVAGGGYIAGHPDCPLCKKAIAAGDPTLLKKAARAALNLGNLRNSPSKVRIA